MTTYYVDDGGSATAPYDTWAKAATSLSALDDAVALASGDIVYIGHDHVCQYVHAANRTITGPTSGAPTQIISATQGSDPATYQQGTAAQVDTSEGSYSLTFDGSFAIYGLKMKSGSSIYLAADTDEVGWMQDCILETTAAITNPFQMYHGYSINCTYIFPASANSGVALLSSSSAGTTFIGAAFQNASYCTGTIFSCNDGTMTISGCDVSEFPATCEICRADTIAGHSIFTGLKTAATWTPASAPARFAKATFVNCGSADQPVSLIYADAFGTSTASSSIYRTSGAAVEGTASAWLITTTAIAKLAGPFNSPYIYGRLASTGSKTFDVYITNDTADFNDNEVWLEVEYKATASSGQWTLITDRPTTITTAPAAQTDDVTSTWNGAGPAFTYKQKLSVTATVNTTGLFRARVCCAVASIAASRYFYIDPKVTVS